MTLCQLESFSQRNHLNLALLAHVCRVKLYSYLYLIPPAPPTPTELTAQVTNSSSVRAAWQWTSSGPVPNCFNTTCVTYRPEGGRESYLQLRDPAATETTLTALQCNTRYTITVVASAGEHRRESVTMAVLLSLLQGMNTIYRMCIHSLNPKTEM